jgi:hypothetical protein
MRQVQPGTVIDARAGVVKLTGASATPGETTPSTTTTETTTTRPTTTHIAPTTTRPATTRTTPTTTQPTTTQTTTTTTEPTTTQTTPTTTEPTTTQTTLTTTQPTTTQTTTSSPTKSTPARTTRKPGATSTAPGGGAADPPSDPAVGDFHGGVFEVLQNGDGVVDLKIQDTQTTKTTCSGSNGSRQLSTRLLGLLHGNGTGRFRTDGDFAAASVLGTDWEVRNQCDGTLIIVRRGTVEVTDLRLHKTVTLHQGQTYLARATS